MPEKVTEMSTETFTAAEWHAQELVELMLKEFQPKGATWARLKRRSGMPATTYKRAFNAAVAMGWFVGGRQSGLRQGLPYNLNANGCWRSAFGPRLAPVGPSLDSAWTSNSKPESKFDRLLAATSMAIQHAGKKG
jgi:hypothetical protein